MRSLTLAPEHGIPARLFGRSMAVKNLNDITLLAELGYVQRLPGRMLLLHPMIREVTVSEYPSGIRECGTLLKSVQKECLFHGADLPYESILLQVVENFIRQTVKNDDDEVSLQIIESSQINHKNTTQEAIFQASTHFNPVDLVCGCWNYKGEAFNLKDFVDANTGFISNKSKDGRELKALELPGLWNGAMADWITVFVEVPITTFNPVKTVNDLLKPMHSVLP